MCFCGFAAQSLCMDTSPKHGACVPASAVGVSAICTNARAMEPATSSVLVLFSFDTLISVLKMMVFQKMMRVQISVVQIVKAAGCNQPTA